MEELQEEVKGRTCAECDELETPEDKPFVEVGGILLCSDCNEFRLEDTE